MGITVTLRGGSGDMLKSTYDSNLDGVFENAQLGSLAGDKITSGTIALARIPGVTQLVHSEQTSQVVMGAITWYDGASLNITTLAVDVLIIASVQHRNINADKWQKFRINVDGASYSQEYTQELRAAANNPSVMGIVHKATLTAAAHTIKVQGYPEAATGYITRSDIAVLELKK